VKGPYSGPLNWAIVQPCMWWTQTFGANFCQHRQPRLARLHIVTTQTRYLLKIVEISNSCVYEKQS